MTSATRLILDPALLSRVLLSEQHSTSEASFDEKELGVLPETGLILIPYSTTTTNGSSDDFTKYQKRFDTDLALLAKTIPLPGEKELREQLVTNYNAFLAAMTLGTHISKS